MRRSITCIGFLFFIALLLGVDGCPTPKPGGPVSINQVGDEFIIQNGYYLAIVDRYGNLASVMDRTGTGETFKKDRIALTTEYHTSPFTAAEYINPTTTILDNHDFYVRLRWSAALRQEGDIRDQYIARTYEFTRSPHIFEQVVVKGAGGEGCASIHPASYDVTGLVWSVEKHPSKGAINSPVSDILAALPDYSTYGGGPQWRVFPRYSSGPSSFSTDPIPTRAVVQDGHMTGSGAAASVGPCSGIVAQTVFSVVAQGMGPTNESLSTQLAQFYPNYGLFDDENPETGLKVWEWINWNVYESPGNEFIPLRRKYVENPTADDWLREDLLVRFAVHMVHRIEQDGGWLSWTRQATERFSTVHARALPSIAYLWSYLTCEGVGRHTPQDADWIYYILNGMTRTLYGTGNTCVQGNFEDVFESGPHYLSYADGSKECLGSSSYRDIRILNSHAHALHFAWIMKSAAEMMGNDADVAAWSEIVSRYHQGSKALYRRAIPGTWNGTPYSGTVNYGVTYRGRTWDINNIFYNDITHNAIPAGYQYSGEYEPEFINAVERACKLDYDVTDNSVSTSPDIPFVARMVRTVPLALVYSGDHVSMNVSSGGLIAGNKGILVGNLVELNKFAWMAHHEKGLEQGWLWQWYEPTEKKPIVERFNKVIWTNKRFKSDWVFPFWTVMDAESIPTGKRFWAGRNPPPGGSPGATWLAGNWVVYRSGNTIEAMAGSDGGTFSLKFPVRTLHFEERYRDYNEATMRWGDSQPGSAGVTILNAGEAGPLELVLSTPVKKKRIITVTVSSPDFPTKDLWILPFKKYLSIEEAIRDLSARPFYRR